MEKLLTGNLKELVDRLNQYTPIDKADIYKRKGQYYLADNVDNTLLEIQLLTDYLGDREISQLLGVKSHPYIHGIRQKHGIGTNRKYNLRYDKGRVRKNYHIHPIHATHFIDGKGLKNIPQIRGHHYKYIVIDNTVIKIIAITDKLPRYANPTNTPNYVWLHIDKRNEPKPDVINLLFKAHNGGMDLTGANIVMDSNQSLETDQTDELGITFIAYGKGLRVINCPLLHKLVYDGTQHINIKTQEIQIKKAYSEFIDIAKGYGLDEEDITTIWVYNSIIEQSFSALSQSLYDNPQWVEEVDNHTEAKELTDGLLNAYWLKDKKPLIKYQIKKLRQRIEERWEKVTVTNSQPQPLKESE